jgi:hypothetical protein
MSPTSTCFLAQGLHSYPGGVLHIENSGHPGKHSLPMAGGVGAYPLLCWRLGVVRLLGSLLGLWAHKLIFYFFKC